MKAWFGKRRRGVDESDILRCVALLCWMGAGRRDCRQAGKQADVVPTATSWRKQDGNRVMVVARVYIHDQMVRYWGGGVRGPRTGPGGESQVREVR